MTSEKLKTHSTNLILLFTIYAVFSIAAMLSGLREYALIQKILFWEGDFSSETANLSIIQSILNILRGLTSLFLAFYFIRWLWFSTLSLEKNPAVFYLNYRPGAAIWSWFIPVINLILPFQVVRDNYEAWENISSSNSGNSSAVVLWWWIVFILSMIAGFFETGIMGGINSLQLEKYSGNPWPFFIPGLMELMAILITIRMMKKFKKFYELTIGA